MEQPPGGKPDQAAAAWRRSSSARKRAERDSQLALRHEATAVRTGNALYLRMAELHRTTAARHRIAAELMEAHARRTSHWVPEDGPPPLFMTGVAEACGSGSVAVTLVDGERNQVATASSDQPARAAQDVEYVLGEGPALDAVHARGPVTAAGDSLRSRWPTYGPAVEELGIGQVVAVPLATPGGCIGALAVFDRAGAVASTAVLTCVADALTRSVFLGRDAVPELFGGIDYRVEVHQAAGMVAVHLGCPAADALELVKARAFGDGRLIGDVARDIVSGQLRLG
ncbi:ANTAR domain-containing protein [Streptomyces sp. SID14478]|uniref:ANTAR domain-containing protein n=1 Tax=Streptomyces sp. SID14478 TaxID=2706073 RepID=UPI0013DD0540|nr:ANTAR domain-containing protein [Streptomyces sp. SID14478]NEB79868.1 ANTAR domain-containing protein [Streptomyces sp. SID14478]